MSEEIKLLTLWGLGYIEFGLCVFSTVGVVRLLVTRAKMNRTSGRVWFDMVQIHLSLALLFVLDGIRAIWDGTHTERFPIVASSLLLPPLYFFIGQSLLRLSKEKNHWITKEPND